MYEINLHKKQLFRRENPLQLQPELHDKMRKFVGFLSEGCICAYKGVREAHSSCSFLGVSVFRQESGLRCLQALDFLLGGTALLSKLCRTRKSPVPVTVCRHPQSNHRLTQTHRQTSPWSHLKALISDPRTWLWGEPQRVVVSFCKIHAIGFFQRS